MTSSIAVLGGTFDPLHIGHLAIAEDVRYTIDAEHVIFIPAAQQPFKTHTPTTPATDRLAMVRLGTADNPAFVVSDLEIRRGGLSYTVETIEQLRAEYSQHELFFIIGADAVAGLPRWHQIGRLLELCRLVLVARPGYQPDLEALFAEIPAARSRVLPVAGPALDVSASELRQRLRSGRPVRYHLPPPVRQYIQEHRLYQDGLHDTTRAVADDR